MRPILILVVFLLATASQFGAEPTLLDISTAGLAAEVKKIVQNCNEDVSASLKRRRLPHATFESEYFDGGTKTFVAEGYRIKLYHHYCSVGGVDGVIFGPSVEFTNTIVDRNGTFPPLAYVRFYSYTEYAKFVAANPRPAPILVRDGKGDTFQDAIIFKPELYSDGIEAEDKWVLSHVQNVKLDSKQHVISYGTSENHDGKDYSVCHVALKDGGEQSVYFDHSLYPSY